MPRFSGGTSRLKPGVQLILVTLETEKALQGLDPVSEGTSQFQPGISNPQGPTSFGHTQITGGESLEGLSLSKGPPCVVLNGFIAGIQRQYLLKGGAHFILGSHLFVDQPQAIVNVRTV